MRIFFVIFLFVAFYSCSDDDETTTPSANTIIYPGSGIGSITFQSTGNDVLDIYGEVEGITLIKQPSGTEYVMWYYDKGVAFRLEEIPRDGLTLQETNDMRFELIEYDQQIYSMTVQPPFDGVTNEGIKLGSTRDDVVAAYGEPDDDFAGAEVYTDLNMYLTYSSTDILSRLDLLK